MRRFSAFLLAGAILITLCGCGSGSGIGPLSVAFSNSVGTVPGGTTFVFSVTTQNDSENRGVNFTLALNTPSNNQTTTPCTSACGTISAPDTTVVADGPKTFTTTTTVTYSAPLLPPTPNNLILTATANASSSVTATDTFTIGAPQIVVRITNKITNITPGSAPVTLNASVQFDTTNAGVTWALTAQGAACSPACGTLSSAEPFSVVYTPPAVVPAAPNNTPTITATSVANTSISDFDDLRIESMALPITVTITNPFTQINAGSPGVTVDAQVENDVADQGVTWSLSPAADAGVLSAEQPLSAIYTPPNNAPQPPNNTATITATSVADSTKSDSFTFTIDAGSTAFVGPYVFLIRGHDDSGNTMAAAGSLISDGAGKITAGEIDLNAAGHTPEIITPVSGTYTSTSSGSVTTSLHIQLGTVRIPGESASLSVDASFKEAVRASTSTSNHAFDFSNGTISGSSQNWTLTGQIGRADLSSAVISNFVDHEFSFSLQHDGSAASEKAEFMLSPSGEVARGLLLRAGNSGNTTYDIVNDIIGGDLSSFDGSGRAVLTLIPEFWREPQHFAVYAASSSNLILVSTDTAERPFTGIGSQVTPTH